VRLRNWIALWVSLAITPVVRAQYRDSFDIDSFIDPRDLGAVLKPNAKTVPGAQYELVTTSAGRIWNYQDLDTFTRQDREFATIGYSRYWSDLQADGTLAVLDSQSRATRWRARFDLGKYQLVESTAESKQDFIGRTGVSLNVDDDLGSAGTSYEISGTTTVQTTSILPDFLRFTGSASVSYRRSQGESTFRALYATSSDLPHPDLLGDRVRFNAGLWLGYETQGGRGRILPIKFRGLMDYYFSDRVGLEMSYGPAYQFASAGVDRGFNNEWLIMLFANVRSKRSTPTPR